MKKNQNKRVFCNDCGFLKHYPDWNCSHAKNRIVKTTAYRLYEEGGNCSTLNKNNDCPLFESKEELWKKALCCISPKKEKKSWWESKALCGYLWSIQYVH